MNLPKPRINQPRKFVAGLLFAALLTFVSTASAQLTVTGTSQIQAVPFTPAWTPSTTGLLTNLIPSTATGNFAEFGTGGSAGKLTAVGTSLQVPASFSGAPNLEMCGSDGTAGSTLVYTLPSTTFGQNITNISVYGAWQDNGRDAQTYAVFYSTVSAPTTFIPLTYVNFNPPNSHGNGGGIGSATRVMINDASGGPIAVNVAALRFEFNNFGAENGSAGYTAITAEGTTATAATNLPIVFTYATQNTPAGTPPSWTIETDSLIAGQTPTALGTGNFANYGIGSPGVSALTDGTYGNVDAGSSYATLGIDGGKSVTYTLTNSVNGSDLTNIAVYSGWANNGRDGQFYHISYSTVSAPTTFIPLTGVFYNPTVGNPVSDRVGIHTSTGAPLAKNVSNVKFDFSEQGFNMDNGASLYAEIIVEGTNSAPPAVGPSPFLVQDTLPTYAETVVGDQVVFTAAYSNSPPAALQWQVIKSGVTNNIAGATNTTLTLNNVQASDSGIYRLKATNSADNTALPSFSSGAPLVVSNSPAAVNNVIVNYAGQTFPGSTNYFPPWPVDTNNLNLIYGFTSGSGQGTFTFVGDFTGGGNFCNADPTILTDGIPGSMTSLPNLAFCAGGLHTSGVGEFVTYTLVTNSAPFGLDLTNITVFGGWQDGGRNEQKYQVLYSTVQAPATFIPLVTADYLPTDTNAQPSVSRTTLIPATGVLAHNVAAVEINFNVSPPPENFWEGYSEILVGGKPSTGFVPSLVADVSPSAASDVVGSQLVLTASFSGATSLQWKLNGTNIPGATTSTLTLNNLQFTNTGAYTLFASNSVGINSSSACALTVNPAPVATNNIVTAIATQTSVAQVFTPTWNTNSLVSSLIYNASPSGSGDGDFTGGDFIPGGPTGGSLPAVLTDGTFGTIDFNQSGLHSWVTCMGSGGGLDPNNNLRGGQYVVYTLPASANGYNITNIMTAGGWNDGGRDQQSYTVNYATSANPTYFTPLAVVSYNPTNPAGYSMSRATITPASGVLASNVVALEFDMTSPAGENGFSGYSEIGVYGSPSPSPAPVGPLITVQHDTNNIWSVETNNLIANQLPSSNGPGSFTLEGCNVTNLTDGVIGFGAPFGASCGADTNAVPFIVFNSSNGWNLTNIIVYTLWHDYGRDGQFYNISYSTLSAPATFLPLASVAYDAPVPHDGRTSGNRVDISPPIGQTMLASNVAALMFDFTPQGTRDFGWSGYTEIVLQGTNLTATTPVPPILGTPRVSGGNLILTGTGGTPNIGYTWLSATNLSATTIWTTNSTGTLDATGSFTNSIPINLSQPAMFFRLRIP